jgi:intein/homing endonuclease
MKDTTIASLFKDGFNVDWKEMEKNKPINVEHLNKYALSYNATTGNKEKKKITAIVRKDDCEAYKVSIDNYYFECSGDHKISVKTDLSSKSFTYLPVNILVRHPTFYTLSKEFSWKKCKVKKEKKTIPILDISVEDNHNYYSNSILSHNSYGNPECVTPDTLVEIL